MACGGCGARRVQAQKTIQTSKTIQPIAQRAVQRSTTTQISKAGVRAQIQRRCPKCTWPMNSMRRLEQATGKQIQVYACMNRKCAHKEEIR
jgi:hypothetical protein